MILMLSFTYLCLSQKQMKHKIKLYEELINNRLGSNLKKTHENENFLQIYQK